MPPCDELAEARSREALARPESKRAASAGGAAPAVALELQLFAKRLAELQGRARR